MKYDHLIEFCTTPRQVECIKALIKYDSQSQAAKELGMALRNLQRMIKPIRARAAKEGVSPENSLHQKIPDGYKLKGFSDMRTNNEGRPIWVKVDADKERQAELMREFVESLAAEIKPLDLSFLRMPEYADEDLANMFPLTDLHIGDRVLKPEHGETWNLEVADKVITGTLGKLVASAPRAGTAILPLMGDIVHFDSGLVAETPHSRHNLESDGSINTIAPVVARILIRAIELMLATHNKVIIPIVKGNHDPGSTAWLATFLPLLFANEKRVEFVIKKDDYGELVRQVVVFGDVMLGFTHGDKTKPSEHPLIFASECSVEWGATKWREFFSGDKHHREEKSVKKGVDTVQLTAPSAANKYPHGKGLSSNREITRFTYHKREGRKGSYVENIDILDL